MNKYTGNEFRSNVRHVKTLFISDLHLGTRACKVSELLAFIKSHNAETIYLVGDVIDTMHAIGRNMTNAHHEIINLLSERTREGVKVIYIPGNHDAFFRKYKDQDFFGFQIKLQDTHTLPNGKKILITHGDECDVFATDWPIVTHIGMMAEELFRGVENAVNRVLAKFESPKFNGIETIIEKVNSLIRGHDHFQERLSKLAKDQGFDGIICGHFHQAALHDNFGVTYANCGDWVENCTAIVEHLDGQLQIIDWQKHTQKSEISEMEFAWV